MIIESESNGHIGTSNVQISQGGTGNFHLILSALKQADGHIEYVIHTNVKNSVYFTVQPFVFLTEIGFQRFQGECPFVHDGGCLYLVFAKTHKEFYNPQYSVQGQNMLEKFLEFAGQVGKLFELRQNEESILQKIGVKSAGKFVIGPPIQLEEDEEDIPLWVNEVKFSYHQDLERKRNKIQTEIDELSQFLPLLYATGTPLEKAVVKALQFLGLKAEQTEKGFTVDVLAQSQDGAKIFGIEITGIFGAVKKDSPKLTQLMEFERIKDSDEKAILLANTHLNTPVLQREKLEDFTPQVLNFFGKHPILLMTGWDLYRMVRDVVDNSRNKEELVGMLYILNGRLNYLS